MDGLEWKRSKYKRPVRQFLKFAERLAPLSSDYLVSDSLGIQKFLKIKYKKNLPILLMARIPSIHQMNSF